MGWSKIVIYSALEIPYSMVICTLVVPNWFSSDLKQVTHEWSFSVKLWFHAGMSLAYMLWHSETV